MKDSHDNQHTGRGQLKRQTVAGAAWVSSGHVAQIVVRFGVIAVLARLLTPADFGLFALALVILELCQTVAPLGTAVALVRLPEVSKAEVGAAFTISMISATLLAGVSIGAASLMEHQMKLPGLLLAVLCMAPAIHFEAVSRIAERMLQRSMSFRPTAVASLLSYVVGYGGIGILMAKSDWGWIALCAAEVASVTLSAAYLLWVGRPHLGFSFDLRVWRDLIGFGATFTASNLIGWGANSTPRVVIGALSGPSSLGLYARAADLSTRLGSLFDRLCTTVLLAAFCRRNEEREKLANALKAATSLILVVMLPCSSILSVLADPIVVLLFGKQWVGAVDAFRILAFLIPLLLLKRLSLVLGQSLGRPGFGVKANAILLVASVVGSMIGVRYGVGGVAIAILIATAVSSVAAFRMVSAELAVGISSLMAPLFKGIALSAGTFIPATLLDLMPMDVLSVMGALERIAMLAPVLCVGLLCVLFFGRTFLFSESANALIAQASSRVALAIDRRRRSSAREQSAATTASLHASPSQTEKP